MAISVLISIALSTVKIQLQFDQTAIVYVPEITISNTLKAVRAFVFMAMLICWAGVLFAVRKAFGKPDSKHFMLINFFFARKYNFYFCIFYFICV